MGIFDRIADLPLTVEAVSRTTQSRDTSSGFTRTTTTISLAGDDATGRGEDVTYDAEDHDALAAAPDDAFDALVGDYTVASFSARLDDVDLFPTKQPERSSSRHYRRWAFESAALDLALRQADQSLGEALGREYDPVRFVVSTRLGDPPTTDRIEQLRERDPDVTFKLDPTSEWTDSLVESLAATGAVRILDLKGHYEGTSVDQAPDPALYERVVEGFPDAVIEDPALTPETDPLFEDRDVRRRVSWDAPITGTESVASLPWPPRWLNVKPSRFGTLRSLFDTVERCLDDGVRLYGGGQFELDVGRGQIQALASLLYPDGPNDVAPGAYNDPEVPDDAPTSPLDPTASVGFGL